VVDVTALADVPPSIHLAGAAKLPVAGLAALRALRAAGQRHVSQSQANAGITRSATSRS
jgi:NADPH:quinone reductase-like Zn-dependent oxidoreductase